MSLLKINKYTRTNLKVNFYLGEKDKSDSYRSCILKDKVFNLVKGLMNF